MEHRSFEQIYLQYYKPVYAYLMTLCQNEELAADIIAISKSFNIDAQIVGRCYDNDEGEGNKLTILSEFGKFIY